MNGRRLTLALSGLAVVAAGAVLFWSVYGARNDPPAPAPPPLSPDLPVTVTMNSGDIDGLTLGPAQANTLISIVNAHPAEVLRVRDIIIKEAPKGFFSVGGRTYAWYFGALAFDSNVDGRAIRTFWRHPVLDRMERTLTEGRYVADDALIRKSLDEMKPADAATTTSAR